MNMGNVKPWTAEEKQMVTNLVQQGADISEISDRTGRSENSVKAVIKKIACQDIIENGVEPSQVYDTCKNYVSVSSLEKLVKKKRQKDHYAYLVKAIDNQQKQLDKIHELLKKK